MKYFYNWFVDNTIASPCKTMFLYRGKIMPEAYWHIYFCETVLSGNELKYDTLFKNWYLKNTPETDTVLFYYNNKYYTKWQMFDYWFTEIYIS